MGNSTKTTKRTTTQIMNTGNKERRIKDTSQTRERVLSLLQAAQFSIGKKTDSVKMIREERA